LSGSGNLDLIAAHGAAGGGYVACCHEAGVVAMADGWAQGAGRVGLATLHQGPGLTNAITALVDSAKARTPLLVVVGDVEPVGGHASQWVDQAAALEGLGVGLLVERLREDEHVAAQLAAALARALARRRPVVLLVPLALQQHDAAALGWDAPGPPAPDLAAPASTAPPAAEVERLGAFLLDAERPVVLAGRGAVLAGAGSAWRAVAERAGAILTTTAPAHGLFAGDPFTTGIAGGFASPLTTELLAQADLVVAVGASLSPWTTCDGRLFPQARLVRVDVAPDADVAGDALAVGAALLSSLPDRGETGWRSLALRSRIAAYRRADALPAPAARGDGVDPARLCVALDARLPPERAFVLDSGHFSAFAAMLLDVEEGGAFFFGQAYQAVGLGLARAIGAAHARADRLTVALVGDGGAMMAFAELDTACRAGLPLLVVIFDDGGYGAEVHDFAPLGVPVDSAVFGRRDFAALARGLGAHALTVIELSDLEALGAWLAAPAGPLVLDVKVDPTVDAVELMTPIGAAEWSMAPRTTQGQT
jgi:5-guanidino-2-oxopentanoate decarboxylase